MNNYYTNRKLVGNAIHQSVMRILEAKGTEYGIISQTADRLDKIRRNYTKNYCNHVRTCSLEELKNIIECEANR